MLRRAGYQHTQCVLELELRAREKLFTLHITKVTMD
jgi:hypothetical protein